MYATTATNNNNMPVLTASSQFPAMDFPRVYAEASSMLDFLGAPPGLEDMNALVSNCSSDDNEEWEDGVSTVAVKKLPVDIMESQVESLLLELGFPLQAVNYINVPIRMSYKKGVQPKRNRGYCFVEFKTPYLASEFRRKAHGHSIQGIFGKKQLVVQRSHIQGLPAKAKVPLYEGMILSL
eukprot:TRINITY_DN6697_c1_g1_i1.p1 TRINITY_DN6697_c1_g1~~TRINITY_DN6697_c1_g1_i1.p1  ORF type:complete len:181 (-),score=43.34 TRINITY_DN6697_c1_g1_i1:130-672(-)